MRSVGSRDTDIEMALRRALWAKGLRYRLHRPTAGTKPDLCFVGSRVAVFVDGCFWHGCPRHYKRPHTNADFWQDKVEQNARRDAEDTARLRQAGWEVLRFWGCDIKENLDEAVAVICESVLRRR